MILENSGEASAYFLNQRVPLWLGQALEEINDFSLKKKPLTMITVYIIQ